MYLKILVFVVGLAFLGCKSSGNNSRENNELSEIELKDSIYSLEKRLLNKQLNTNIQTAKLLQEASNHFADKFPNSEDREDILYKSVLAARGMNKPYFAIQTLSKLIIEYPNSKHLVDYKYEKASVFDFQLNAKGEAKKVYQEIVDNHPDSEWADDSKARLETIDLSDEELIKKFEEQNGQ